MGIYLLFVSIISGTGIHGDADARIYAEMLCYNFLSIPF